MEESILDSGLGGRRRRSRRRRHMGGSGVTLVGRRRKGAKRKGRKICIRTSTGRKVCGVRFRKRRK